VQAPLALPRFLDRVDLGAQVVRAQEIIADPQPACGVAF
jgi:hypothetical protein